MTETRSSGWRAVGGTGLGKIEIGIADGAGYGLAVTGPKVDAGVSLEDARTSFFRDPGSHRALSDMFALRTAVGASSNYAKIVYTSPALFGAQLALSFTPSEGKQLPFLNAGPPVPGRQVEFWEAALRYETELGPVSLSAYSAVSESRAEHKLADRKAPATWAPAARRLSAGSGHQPVPGRQLRQATLWLHVNRPGRRAPLARVTSPRR
jgi:hypothetical protein